MGKNNLSITALNGEFQRFSQIATAPTDTTFKEKDVSTKLRYGIFTYLWLYLYASYTLNA